MEKCEKIMKIIGENVLKHREEKKYTQEKLAELSGVSDSCISSLETGVCRNISVEKLVNISNALNSTLISIISNPNFEECNTCEESQEGGIQPTNEIETLDNTKTYYPPIIPGATISSLLEFIIVLPLLDSFLLYDSICRIFGDTFNQGDYVTSQLDFIWRKVPDSPAKRFAASELEKSHMLRQGIVTPSEEQLKLISNPEKEKEFDEYYQLILDKYNFIKNIKLATDSPVYFNITSNKK